MTVETATYINQLNPSWPLQSDIVREGAGHIRTTKSTLQASFPNVAGAVSASHVQLSYVTGVTSAIQPQIDSKGAIAGQTWTGPHVFSSSITVPTLAQGTSTIGAASTAFVQNEWATRLPNYTGPITASTAELNRVAGVTSGIQAQIDSKGAINGQTWSGTHSFPSTTTVGPLTPTKQGYLATVTSDVQVQIDSKGAINGQVWSGAHDFRSGSVLAPTRTTGDSTQNVATTAFVAATALSSSLPGQTGNAGKFVTTDGSAASWDWAQLGTVVHTAGGVLQVGKLNILNCTGQAFTLPASFTDKDPLGFVHVDTASINTIDWGTRNLFGRQPGVMTLSGNNVRGYVRWNSATGGFV